MMRFSVETCQGLCFAIHKLDGRWTEAYLLFVGLWLVSWKLYSFGELSSGNWKDVY